nr:hypothetical protein [Tanacetum cinerariifolium]
NDDFCNCNELLSRDGCHPPVSWWGITTSCLQPFICFVRWVYRAVRMRNGFYKCQMLSCSIGILMFLTNGSVMILASWPVQAAIKEQCSQQEIKVEWGNSLAQEQEAKEART